jgi:ABC-type multidrug transport system, ATPase and permease components
MPMLFIVFMQQVVNMVQRREENFNIIAGYIIGFICLHIANEILEMLYFRYSNRFSLKFSKHVGMQMMEKALRLSLRDFEDSDTYDIINRAQNQTGSSILDYIGSIFDILQQIISIAGMSYILLRFKWQIAMIILIVPAGRCIATFFIDKERYVMRTGRTRLERQKWYINFLVMTGNAFKEIKTLGIGKFLLKKYEGIQNNIIAQEDKMYKKSTLISVGLDITDWLITGGIYLYTFFLGFIGSILIGDVTAYIESTDNIKDAVEGIFSGINELTEQSMYINLMFEYLELAEVTGINRKKIEAIRCIEFRNVSFKYCNGKYALKNASFFIQPGESVALIGENGSGKTTLTKLLLGLYDDYEGEILVNDINLKQIGIESYQEKIGTVFQDYVKYEASLRENIAFGDMNLLSNDEAILHALKAVNLEHKAKGTEGLDTVIGSWFGGKQFSIGEWQRLAIARALIRKADVYIFDEPDASLDVFRQKEIILLFKKMMKHKIGIYVSHKTNFVNELADKLIVIQNGEITEMGTHKELMEKEGYYFQLYKESMDNNAENMPHINCCA